MGSTPFALVYNTAYLYLWPAPVGRALGSAPQARSTTLRITEKWGGQIRSLNWQSEEAAVRDEINVINNKFYL
jgi:hypothetical protein